MVGPAGGEEVVFVDDVIRNKGVAGIGAVKMEPVEAQDNIEAIEVVVVRNKNYLFYFGMYFSFLSMILWLIQIFVFLEKG